MEPRLSVVTLAADDLGRAVTFYRSLGWSAAFENEEVAFFQLNGVVLSLYRSDLFRSEYATEDAPSSRVALAYNGRSREEVDEALALAGRAGGRVVAPARETDWGGYAGAFADPDGHRWEVAWNPAWPIDDDGNVRMAP